MPENFNASFEVILSPSTSIVKALSVPMRRDIIIKVIKSTFFAANNLDADKLFFCKKKQLFHNFYRNVP